MIVMKEIEILKSMWNPKSQRTTNLIIPSITQEGIHNSLNNEAWAWKVPFCFCAALDISYDARRENSKSYMVWTQGPIISFKAGDTLNCSDGTKAVQVESASSMAWNLVEQKMNLGTVLFNEYDIGSQNGKYTKTNFRVYNQMQFLEMLIYGNKVQ